MPSVNLRIGFLAALLFCSCSVGSDPLVVKQFQLRDQEDTDKDDPMVRGEKLRRLHGAVSLEERRQQLGQYYTVLWQDEEGVGRGPVEVVFEYQQGGTASRVKREVRRFGAEEEAGTAEFSVIGDNYFQNGKVLAWRVGLRRAGKEIAHKRSYLWQ